MDAPFQIMPATPDKTEEILVLKKLCYPNPWGEQLVKAFLKEKGTIVAYAFTSRQDGQLLVERLGVRPENRRKGIGSGLIVSLIFEARKLKLPAITCSLDEENLAGQLLLKIGGFNAPPVSDEARREKVIQFARSAKG